MAFIHDDFLLGSKPARKLYHAYAVDEPILDYHNHLPPQDVAGNRQFNNLFEIWLEGDHYKWRAMRANGTEERLCTGKADPKEKFLAFARTVPNTLRNPLYHWTHLELKRYFGIDELLSETTADAIWEQANDQLATESLRTHGILETFKVKALCTTDDPVDDLAHHQAYMATQPGCKMYPAFRPDKAFAIADTDNWNAWVDRLGAASDTDIATYENFKDALKQRHDFFHAQGGRLSDHGMSYVYADFIPEPEAAEIFDIARAGGEISQELGDRFAANVLLYTGQLDAEKGWTKQFHVGALRNNNQRLFKSLGADIGCDSMGDWSQAEALSTFLSRLDAEGGLPRTIIYNNNPVDNYTFATMIGNYQGDGIPGKMQFGSGWWHLDQKEGMEMQLNALSNTGLLARFVGMLTDSRSFMSFPRHEYFRRTLCNLIGRDIANGELPDDYELVGNMVRNICYANARDYLQLDVD
ncbi:MAG: glucuronate isomerase [Kiritimatiellia bacterium]|jgi:glucuronate isomerase